MGFLSDRLNMLRGLRLTALMLVVALVLPGQAMASIIRDTEIEEALLRVARPMAEEAGLNPDQLKVRIVIDSSYNAFVMGDGIVYIHSGLILKAENYLEVAGVIAHEIGHIASGHVQQRGEVIENASMASLLGAVAAIALSAAGSGDAAVGLLVGGADKTQRIVMARSRQDEGVADEWAMRLMKNQGYSLRPMSEMMRGLASQRLLPQSRQTDYYLTHPGAMERSAVFQDHINRHEPEELPEPEWMTADFNAMRAKLEAWTNPAKTTIAQTIGDSSETGRYQKAIAFYRLSDLEAAGDTMLELATEFPENPYYQEFYGDILLSIGDGLGAASRYENTLSGLQPGANAGQIYLSLGRAYMATGNPEYYPRAIETLEAAEQLEPEWAFVKRQLGISYGKAGQLAAADLILAEEAMLRRKPELAHQLAQRVADNPKASATQKQLAADIILETAP